MDERWFLDEDDLDLPKPPEIFQANVFFLKNKRSVLAVILTILIVPLFFITIDVQKDGPSYVDLDIRKFRLEKHEKNSTLKYAPRPIGTIRERKSFNDSLRAVSERKVQVKDITFALTSCGRKSLERTVVAIKSVVTSALNNDVNLVTCHIFVDTEETMDELNEALNEVQEDISWASSLTLKFEVHFAVRIFPKESLQLWINLYKKCASLHLFILKSLPTTKEILFLDTDTLVLGDIRELWSFFSEMDERQFAGLALEQDSGSLNSFYQTHSRVPFVPPTGVSAGVMLLNLTRMRQFDWEKKVINTFESFAQDLLLGDQDIINTMFYFNREYLKILPCIYNYRRVNCKIMQHCEETRRHPDGIQVLHGNSDSFKKDGDFRKIYELYRKFDLHSGDFKRDIVLPFKWHYKKLELSKKMFSSGCVAIGRRIFNSWVEEETFFVKNEKAESKKSKKLREKGDL